MAELPIRAQGKKNSQVTEEVKEFLYQWFESHGVFDARNGIVCHHYLHGDVVAVSDCGTSAGETFEECQEILADAHPDHTRTSTDCVWVRRKWLAEQID
jgi:hypothetical protein